MRGIISFACALIVFLVAGCGGNVVVKKIAPDHIVHLREYRQLDGVKNFYRYAGYIDKNNTGDRILPRLDGVEALKEYAGYLDKGDTFPLFLSLDNDVVGVSGQDPVTMLVRQKFYFMMTPPDRLSKEGLAELEKVDVRSIPSMSESDKARYWHGFMLYVSRDAVTWAPAWDWRALREALGIKSGSYSFGAGLSDKEGFSAQFGFATVAR